MPGEKHIETALLIALGGFSVSLFFSQTGISVFGPLSLVLLVILRLRESRTPIHPALKRKTVPLFVVVAVSLFTLDVLFGAFLSENRLRGFNELKKYWNVLLCGMLYTCSLTDGRRRIVAAVFFSAAGAAGAVGMSQFILHSTRAHGFAHPIHFATVLSFACAAALMMLFIKNDAFRGKGWSVFLLATATATFGGMLLSQTRGVWIAFSLSIVIALSLHSLKKAAILAAVLAMLLSLTFAFSVTLSERASSIYTSYFSENEQGSTGNRVELWKGAVMIFKESPVFGTGTGDFTIDIERLISEGRIRNAEVRSHAHSIYFQWLSTQGLAGLVLLVLLFLSLIWWGLQGIRQGDVGGYIIVLATLIIAIGGLTENNIGISKIFSAYCVTVGLIGGFGNRRPDSLT